MTRVCSNYISSAEIIHGEKHYLGPLRQMKREPKRLFVKFFKSFTIEVIIIHFVRWLIIHGIRESKNSVGGGDFVRFSYFMYVTCCRFALFFDIYALF